MLVAAGAYLVPLVRLRCAGALVGLVVLARLAVLARLSNRDDTGDGAERERGERHDPRRATMASGARRGPRRRSRGRSARAAAACARTGAWTWRSCGCAGGLGGGDRALAPGREDVQRRVAIQRGRGRRGGLGRRSNGSFGAGGEDVGGVHTPRDGVDPKVAPPCAEVSLGGALERPLGRVKRSAGRMRCRG